MLSGNRYCTIGKRPITKEDPIQLTKTEYPIMFGWTIYEIDSHTTGPKDIPKKLIYISKPKTTSSFDIVDLSDKKPIPIKIKDIEHPKDPICIKVFRPVFPSK